MSNPLDRHVAAYEGRSIYDFDNDILLNWYPKRITQLAGPVASLLELGLGHGFSTNVFSQHFTRHVVLEGSPAVIANFKAHHPGHRAEIVETLFETFSTDERFDIIVLGFILEHVDNPVEIIARYKERLAPDGRMFVAVPNAEVLNRRLGHLAGLLPDMQALSDYDRLLGHQRYFTVDSLKQACADGGCRVERVEGIYLKPFTTSQIVSLNLDRRIIDALCEVGIDLPDLSCGILAELKDARAGGS